MHSDRCGNTRGQECRAEGSGKEAKIQELMYRDTTNVEHGMYDYTVNNWSHRNSMDSLQGLAILGTSHIIRTILQFET
jgi:hypothetical protein